MGILDATEFEPLPEMGARRVRMAMSGAVHQVEQALRQVDRIMAEHGRDVIASKLGEADDADLIQKYGELKAFVEKFGRTVPDLAIRK